MAYNANYGHGPAGGWLTCLARVLLPLGLFAIALFGGGVNAAHAAPDGKVAADLKTALSAATRRWAANTSRGMYVQVVIERVLGRSGAHRPARGRSSRPAAPSSTCTSRRRRCWRCCLPRRWTPSRRATTLPSSYPIASRSGPRASCRRSQASRRAGLEPDVLRRRGHRHRSARLRHRHLPRRVRRPDERQQRQLQAQRPHRSERRLHAPQRRAAR